MQENDFEKKVKEMMDEFQLQPSGEVWPKIDRRINSDRRRKTPFILLLVCCLLVAGFIMYRYEETSVNYEAKNNVKDSVGSLNKTNVLKDANTIVVHNDEQANKNDTASLIYAERNTKMNTGNIHRTGKYSAKTLVAVTTQKENTQSLQTNINQQNVDQTNQPTQDATIRKEDTSNAKTVDNNAEVKEQQDQSRDSINASNNNAATTNVISNNILKSDSIESTQHNTNNNKTTSKNTQIKLPKLQWGINMFYGGSNAVNDLVSSNKSLPSSLNSGGGNFDTAYVNGKPYSASASYSIGGVVEKRIIKNGFIGAGLNYIHLSTKSTVGKSIDSTLFLSQSAYAINNFYQSGTASTYTNHYNFIELPVYFRQDLFPSKELSLSYNAGFSLRQLLSTNSLVYDQDYNIYFSKDDALNKTQFQLLAGLSLKINSIKNTSIYIGPQFSYSLSGLFKNNNSNNFHFITYGLQAGLLFHKK